MKAFAYVNPANEKDAVAALKVDSGSTALPLGGGQDLLSRMKDYVRQRYGMNTSDAVMEVLSDQLRKLCDRAVIHARDDGRKTLMDRDFEFLTER